MIFHEKFDNLDRKMNFYLTTSVLFRVFRSTGNQQFTDLSQNVEFLFLQVLFLFCHIVNSSLTERKVRAGGYYTV